MENNKKKEPIYCGVESSVTGKPIALEGEEREKFIALVKGDRDREILYCPEGLAKQLLDEIRELKKR